MRPAFNVALLIPTGVGAAIGGYGGDGMTLLPLFASVCDMVITHPNVANAAMFQTLPENVLYVEGYAMDRFCAGDWALQPVRQNRVGVIWDSGIPEDMAMLHHNTIDAVRTVYGVDIIGLEATREPVSLQLALGPSGRSAGQVANPHVLCEAADKLIAQGATALAVCCLMPSELDDHTEDYSAGVGVDPIGGLEAMISHMLVARYKLPVAHAPVFTYEEAQPVRDRRVDAKAVSEFITATFLPCVLTGLRRAPQYGDSGLSQKELSAVVVPADALGSVPVLSAVEAGIPVLAIHQNQTAMQATAESLGLEAGIIQCATYFEALGRLVALKAGITPPPHFTWS